MELHEKQYNKAVEKAAKFQERQYDKALEKSFSGKMQKPKRSPVAIGPSRWRGFYL